MMASLIENFESFERNFNYSSYLEWHMKLWPLVYPVIALYLASIFFIQKWMVNRPAYSLKKPLLIWNTCLALFSVWGATRSVPELMNTIKSKGLRDAICESPAMSSAYSLSVAAFILSKFLELGDTMFIVLRKQKLIFLHWYHHVTVLFCVCFTVNYPLSTLRWYVSTNYTVHSVMYTYYALKAMKFTVPKFIAILITTGQMVQMVIAFTITWYAANEKVHGRQCNVDVRNILLGLICYGSYFYLFGRFFYFAYCVKREKKNESIHLPKAHSIQLDANRNKIKST